MKKIFLFDSTLRDGAQAQGISFSVQDKLKIARILDDLQVDYIEAGNPGSNPKDMQFFGQIKNNPLKNAVTGIESGVEKNNFLHISGLPTMDTYCEEF